MLVPYFVWGLIYSGFTFENVAKLLFGSYPMIISSGSLTSLWFLPAMFISVMLVNFVSNVIENKFFSIVFLIVACFTIANLLPSIGVGYPWCINAAILGSGFMLIGWLFEQKLGTKLENKTVLIVLLITGIVLTLLSYLNIPKETGYVLMANSSFGNMAIFFLAAMAGCISIYCLGKLIPAKGKFADLFGAIGKNTLVIFVIHKPIIELFEKLFEKIPIFWGIELLITVAGTLIICCMACLFINRYMKCLAGK